MQVGNWMEKDFEKIPLGLSVGKVKEMLRRDNLSCGIVCDGEKFVGIVKADEILGIDDSLSVSNYVERVVYTLDPQDTLDEASVFFLEADIERLPVLEDGKIVGVLSLFQILDAFTQMAGFGEGGLRMEIELEDTPGELKKVIDVLYAHSMNVLSILIHPVKEIGKRVAILRVHGNDVKDLSKILDLNNISYRTIIKEEKI